MGCCVFTHDGDAISVVLEEEEDLDEEMKTPPATRTNNRVVGAWCHGEEGRVRGVACHCCQSTTFGPTIYHIWSNKTVNLRVAVA
jgi:hypothetical protein